MDWKVGTYLVGVGELSLKNINQCYIFTLVAISMIAI